MSTDSNAEAALECKLDRSTNHCDTRFRDRKKRQKCKNTCSVVRTMMGSFVRQSYGYLLECEAHASNMVQGSMRGAALVHEIAA